MASAGASSETTAATEEGYMLDQPLPGGGATPSSPALTTICFRIPALSLRCGRSASWFEVRWVRVRSRCHTAIHQKTPELDRREASVREFCAARRMKRHRQLAPLCCLAALRQGVRLEGSHHSRSRGRGDWLSEVKHTPEISTVKCHDGASQGGFAGPRRGLLLECGRPLLRVVATCGIGERMQHRKRRRFLHFPRLRRPQFLQRRSVNSEGVGHPTMPGFDSREHAKQDDAGWVPSIGLSTRPLAGLRLAHRKADAAT